MASKAYTCPEGDIKSLIFKHIWIILFFLFTMAIYKLLAMVTIRESKEVLYSFLKDITEKYVHSLDTERTLQYAKTFHLYVYNKER